jgi:CheY-like chemotaxis protein/HPt (histidine-containing phosphotransfer) domain-containing protein
VSSALPTVDTTVAEDGPWRGARVLVAEDNATNQLVAVGVLQKLGIAADVAANGAEAIRALETRPYDLVLMDVHMPEMDGYEATRGIRGPESRVLDHGIPIVAMTANAMRGDRERCLEAGMDDYLSKPVSPQELEQSLRRNLRRKDLGPSAATNGTARDGPSAVSDESPPPVFDKAGLMQRLTDDENLAGSVVRVYLAEAPSQIRGLSDGLDAGDGAGVVRHSHNIKGASANVGAEAVRRLASKMEESARGGDLAGVQTLMPDLLAGFEAFGKAVSQEFALEAGPAQEEPRPREAA